MNLLRPAQTVGSLLRWSQRASAMTISTPNYCRKYTASWAESRDYAQPRLKPVLTDQHIKFLHTKQNVTKRELIGVVDRPASISVINRLADNVGPYARLMRMDRPIGEQNVKMIDGTVGFNICLFCLLQDHGCCFGRVDGA